MSQTFPKGLTIEEKKYLLSVERGDLVNVKRMLQRAHKYKSLDINCVDSLGRNALTLAIDSENLEMVELLVVMAVQTKDGLLHAINVEFVEAVELLLEHEELVHRDTDSYSWQKVSSTTSTFTSDMTPLILAAHRNNYEILKILLDRGATLPLPHDIKCGCEDCIKERREDSLRHSLSRVNIYKALASPSLIALSSTDPILTAFQLSWELRSLGFAEPECKSEYWELRKQCQKFAVDLLHQSRDSQELAIILNHNSNTDTICVDRGHMKLSRLTLAIQYKQKQFVAHPNIQQLLAAIWYEGVPGFRRKSAIQKVFIILKVALVLPFYCILYMVAPQSNTAKLVRKPYMKFLIHASSYVYFLIILILVSQRVEEQIVEVFKDFNVSANQTEEPPDLKKGVQQRGNQPTVLEYFILVYVIGFIYEETYTLFKQGFRGYFRNLWNFIYFTRNSLYFAVFILRLAAFLEQHKEISENPKMAFIAREDWEAFDPQLIAEGLFAAANIFSALKLVHLFSINPYLGPLQVSLGRMVIDIVKFFFIYALVLFAFACGLNQLLWYFSDLERKKCFREGGEACSRWRGFANVFEASQSLFWASFGLLDLNHFELTGIKAYTRFWGLLMFGSYSVINIIVLLNLLIAMMSNSYAVIDCHSDTEWKFARTKLWMSYFEDRVTLPPPFNILPTSKLIRKICGLQKRVDKLQQDQPFQSCTVDKIEHNKYATIMRALVWRYITSTHRKQEESSVTEDDINEVKGDISAFRYEILNVLSKNGMDCSCADRKEKAILGKKMKIWERRLMKDFKVAPINNSDYIETTSEDTVMSPEDSLTKFRRVANMATLNPNLRKWKEVVKEVCNASHIGKSHTRTSLQKIHNLEKAMADAKSFLESDAASEDICSSQIKLPDISGESILNVIKLPLKERRASQPLTPEVKVRTLSKSEHVDFDYFDDQINEREQMDFDDFVARSSTKISNNSDVKSLSFGWL